MTAEPTEPKRRRWYRKWWGVVVIGVLVYVLSYCGFRLVSESWTFRDNKRDEEIEAFYFVLSRGIVLDPIDNLPVPAMGFREGEDLLALIFYPMIQLETALNGNVHASRFRSNSHENPQIRERYSRPWED